MEHNFFSCFRGTCNWTKFQFRWIKLRSLLLTSIQYTLLSWFVSTGSKNPVIVRSFYWILINRNYIVTCISTLRQLVAKHVLAATNTQTTIEELPFLCNNNTDTPYNKRGIARIRFSQCVFCAWSVSKVYTGQRRLFAAIDIWSWAPDGARNQDLLTDWPSVAMWLRLELCGQSQNEKQNEENPWRLIVSCND
jgi:hypothetical protein